MVRLIARQDRPHEGVLVELRAGIGLSVPACRHGDRHNHNANDLHRVCQLYTIGLSIVAITEAPRIRAQPRAVGAKTLACCIDVTSVL